jgi:hypothetical protein
LWSWVLLILSLLQAMDGQINYDDMIGRRLLSNKQPMVGNTATVPVESLASFKTFSASDVQESRAPLPTGKAKGVWHQVTLSTGVCAEAADSCSVFPCKVDAVDVSMRGSPSGELEPVLLQTGGFIDDVIAGVSRDIDEHVAKRTSAAQAKPHASKTPPPNDIQEHIQEHHQILLRSEVKISYVGMEAFVKAPQEVKLSRDDDIYEAPKHKTVTSALWTVAWATKEAKKSGADEKNTAARDLVAAQLLAMFAVNDNLCKVSHPKLTSNAGSLKLAQQCLFQTHGLNK